MNRITLILGLLAALTLSPALQAPVHAAPRRGTARRQIAPRGKGPRLRARARLMHMGLKRSAARAKVRFARGRLARAFQRGRRRLHRLSLATSARLTAGADWIQRRLPSRLGVGFGQLRLANPLGMGSFAAKLFKSDPKFMTGYLLWSYAFSNLQVPLFMSMGLGAGAALVLRSITGFPIDVAAIALRRHALRKDRSQTFGGTLRQLGRDYRDHVRSQQVRNRAVYRAISEGHPLQRLGAAL